MDSRRVQLRISSMLALIACVALNLWLFRLGPLWGILGLNISKHVVIAALCQWVGVDHGKRPSVTAVAPGRVAPSEPITSVT